MKGIQIRVVVILAAAAVACGGKAEGPKVPGNSGAEPVGPVALPGECVEVMPDAKMRLAAMYEQGAQGPMAGSEPFAEEQPAEHAGPDVDGDGTPDRFVTSPEWLEAGIEAALVYVMRGDCGHYVGDVGSIGEAGTDRAKGLLDLKVIENASCEGAPCGCETGTTVFRFDGTAYAQDEAASTTSSEKPCDE